jgi:phage-related protein
MAIETFVWCPKTEAQGTTTQRVRTSQFGDGYAQVVGDGINGKSQSWNLTFVGKEAVTREIRDFLDSHRGYKSFLWTPPLGDLGLYRAEEYQLTGNGAGVYTITVTFNEAFAP